MLYTNSQAIVYLYRTGKAVQGSFLGRTAANTNEQRSESDLCERVSNREATETEGIEFIYTVQPPRSGHLPQPGTYFCVRIIEIECTYLKNLVPVY